ncbi:sporulation protein rmd1 [Balamuthia mandrillaris]
MSFVPAAAESASALRRPSPSFFAKVQQHWWPCGGSVRRTSHNVRLSFFSAFSSFSSSNRTGLLLLPSFARRNLHHQPLFISANQPPALSRTLPLLPPRRSSPVRRYSQQHSSVEGAKVSSNHNNNVPVPPMETRDKAEQEFEESLGFELNQDEKFKFMPQKCIAICTAQSYALKSLQRSLQEEPFLDFKVGFTHRNVLQLKNGAGEEIFVFNFGSFVTWGITSEAYSRFLERVAEYRLGPSRYLTPDEEEFEFTYGDKTGVGGPSGDTITLESDRLEVKLPVAYALGQSVKLGLFESTLEESWSSSQQFPHELATHGKAVMPPLQVGRTMGNILVGLMTININNAEFSFHPDIFWDFDRQEMIWGQFCRYLDLQGRLRVLEKQLEVLNRIYDTMQSEKDKFQSHRLEWIIIGLIFIEVVISLIAHVPKWRQAYLARKHAKLLAIEQQQQALEEEQQHAE